ncbi:MAG: iron ABC transporter ATP-binding protein [Desulfobulbaceae bacterium A2]|nr:MAG: iron ABC transporter ATP-binding protein [Desulfobulbaceae bacterium A2]
MILEVRGLNFAYNGQTVLHDIDLRLDGGELLAILGPNGVGKTTLLRCINAIQRPQRGSVLVEDRAVFDLRPEEVALAIGYVAQRTDTAKLTVFDAILMGRKPHIRWQPAERDLRIVDSAIHHLRLEHLLLRPLDRLSGGELQKVAIARALVQEPRLLLLDEPTSFLDLRNQVEILDMLRHVVSQHRIAAVMTMHDINTALRYADHALFLKDGAIHALVPIDGITADMVEEVYGLPVEIHRLNGYPIVVPTP